MKINADIAVARFPEFAVTLELFAHGWLAQHMPQHISLLPKTEKHFGGGKQSNLPHTREHVALEP